MYDQASGAVWQASGGVVGQDEGSLPNMPPMWISDASAGSCMAIRLSGEVCGRAFDLMEWRHHCRFCGKVVCSKCSSKSALLPLKWAPYAAADFDWGLPRRVCDSCFLSLAPFQEYWAAERAHAHKSNAVDGTGTSIVRYMNSPVSFALADEVKKAAYALQNLTDGVNYWDGDAEYIHKQLRNARGLLFLTVARLAFIGGLRVGTGLVVARADNDTHNYRAWTAPCAVGIFGLTFGAVVGAEVSDTIVSLDENALLELADESTAKISLGGRAGLAFGPIGRAASGEALLASDASASAATSYSHSRGFYGGVTLEGAYLKVRDDVNLAFYGKSTQARDILLHTSIQPPNAAQPLYAHLDTYYAKADAYAAERPEIFMSSSDINTSSSSTRKRNASSTNNPFFFLCAPSHNDDQPPQRQDFVDDLDYRARDATRDPYRTNNSSLLGPPTTSNGTPPMLPPSNSPRYPQHAFAYDNTSDPNHAFSSNPFATDSPEPKAQQPMAWPEAKNAVDI